MELRYRITRKTCGITRFVNEAPELARIRIEHAQTAAVCACPDISVSAVADRQYPAGAEACRVVRVVKIPGECPVTVVQFVEPHVCAHPDIAVMIFVDAVDHIVADGR
jgi:hypothetical protein